MGASLATSSLLLIGELESAVSSPAESNLLDLKRKNNQFCDTVNSIFVRQTCCVLNNFSYSISLRFA